MNLNKVYLIRHGETDWNIQRRWQGYAPIPLNENGRQQAKALASYLHAQDTQIDTIISSDLSRAWDTAAPLAAALGIEIQADQRWREFSLGIFQGLTNEEIPLKYPAEWECFHADYWDYRIPEGESRRELQNRVALAWLDMLEKVNGSEAAVVSHGGALRMLLLRLFTGDPRLDPLHLGNTGITTLERINGDWKLIEVGATPHLPD